MAVIEQGAPTGFDPGARNTAAALSVLGALLGAIIVVMLFVSPALLAQWGVERDSDAVTVSLLAAGVVFMLLGGIIVIARLGLGGAIALIGVLFWVAGCISFKSFGWVLGAPLLLAFLGLLYVLNAIARLGLNQLLAVVGESFALDLRRRLLGALERLPTAFYARRSQADISQRVVNDVEVIQQVITRAAVPMFVGVLSIVF